MVLSRLEMLHVAYKVAWSLHGLPYVWGGDDSVAGYDCSGYVIEILKSVGKLPVKGDWRARDLFSMYKNFTTDTPRIGCLVFWGKSEASIIHVEFCLNNLLSIGASGGGSKTLTREDAIEQNAYIKVRPMNGRGNIIAFVDPFMNDS